MWGLKLRVFKNNLRIGLGGRKTVDFLTSTPNSNRLSASIGTRGVRGPCDKDTGVLRNFKPDVNPVNICQPSNRHDLAALQ